MVILEIFRFGENVFPSLDEEEQVLPEVPEELKKYVGSICQFNLTWFKDGVKYSFTQRTDWWEEVASRHISEEPKEEGEDIPDEIKRKSVEELAEELANFIKKEFPESYVSSPGFMYQGRRLFWDTKGLKETFSLDPQIRVKIERTQVLAATKLNEEIQKIEKELVPKLVDECVKWANDNGLKKVTKTNVDFFLSERNQILSKTSRDSLYNKVNMILIKDSK